MVVSTGERDTLSASFLQASVLERSRNVESRTLAVVRQTARHRHHHGDFRTCTTLHHTFWHSRPNGHSQSCFRVSQLLSTQPHSFVSQCRDISDVFSKGYTAITRLQHIWVTSSREPSGFECCRLQQANLRGMSFGSKHHSLQVDEYFSQGVYSRSSGICVTVLSFKI